MISSFETSNQANVGAFVVTDEKGKNYLSNSSNIKAKQTKNAVVNQQLQ